MYGIMVRLKIRTYSGISIGGAGGFGHVHRPPWTGLVGTIRRGQ